MATPTDDDNADDCISGNYYGYERGGTLGRTIRSRRERSGDQMNLVPVQVMNEESGENRLVATAKFLFAVKGGGISS